MNSEYDLTIGDIAIRRDSEHNDTCTFFIVDNIIFEKDGIRYESHQEKVHLNRYDINAGRWGRNTKVASNVEIPHVITSKRYFDLNFIVISKEEFKRLLVKEKLKL